MYEPSVKQQISQRDWEKEKAREGRDRRGSGHSGAIEREVDDGVEVPPVDPEVVAVFVEDENFRRELRAEDPFPLEHDRLGGADDAGDRVIFGLELGVKAFAGRGARIIGYAEDFAVKPLRHSGIAGHEVDLEILAIGFMQSGNEVVEQPARSALDEEHFCERRIPAAEKVAQTNILTVG